MGKLAILGVGAIAVLVGGCILAIALATGGDRPAGRGASAVPARVQTANGGVVIIHDNLAGGQPSSPGESSALVLPSPPTRTDGVRTIPPEQMKAVDWNRKKPPRSAEDEE